MNVGIGLLTTDHPSRPHAVVERYADGSSAWVLRVWKLIFRAYNSKG